MRTGFAACTQHRAGEQSAEPRHVLQRFDPVPGIGCDRRRQRRRQFAGLIDDTLPVLDPGVLIPVEIVDQRIALALAQGFSREGALGSRHGRVDGGESVREQRVGRIGRSSVDELFIVGEFAILASDRSISFPVALPAPAAQAIETSRRQRPIRFGTGDAAPRSQHGPSPGQLMGWGADIHAGVVENQIFEVDEFALEPQTGAGVGIMGARDPAVADRAFGQTARRGAASESSAAASGPTSWAHGSGSGIW